MLPGEHSHQELYFIHDVTESLWKPQRGVGKRTTPVYTQRGSWGLNHELLFLIFTEPRPSVS